MHAPRIAGVNFSSVGRWVFRNTVYFKLPPLLMSVFSCIVYSLYTDGVSQHGRRERREKRYGFHESGVAAQVAGAAGCPL